MSTNEYQNWKEYTEKTLEVLTPLLKSLGFTLEQEQPHISGERYLMQAVTTKSGRKLILIGRRDSDNLRVVIKATKDSDGISEILHEHNCREILHRINFAHKVFFSPEEILFTQKNDYTISIQAFVEQERQFIERPTKEQFTLALKAFKAQEGAHATTYGHQQLTKKTFGSLQAVDYLKNFKTFKSKIIHTDSDELVSIALLNEAEKLLVENRETIEQYNNFLTHTDFVPHNFRVVGDNLYLLDYSSIHFGNKYEGWARFLNFMALYNPRLEQAFVEYVHLNRTHEEMLALKLMRVYRLGEIIWYYINTLDKCSGDLCQLNKDRVNLWSFVLKSILHNENISEDYLKTYRAKREVLRSEDEKQRQKGLH